VLEVLVWNAATEVVVLVMVTVIQLYVDAKPVKLLVVLFGAKSVAIVSVATLVSEVSDVLFMVALGLVDVAAFE
jgi:hypothetical protein